jgi:beta-mannosidase
VRQLYNHPSIFVWCCHNEPSFNRHELDPVLQRAARAEDRSRYVDAASDFHLHPYPGWYMEDSVWKDTPGAIGPGVTFFSEFGAQALPGLPTLEKMFRPKELWPPDWKKWAFHDFQYFQTFNVAKIQTGHSIRKFVENSQEYQARMVKELIQTFRLRKYNPMNGYFHFMFVDCWPAITWSVVDYFRRPKSGYDALRTVSQPLLPVWRIYTTQYNRGDILHWGASFLGCLVIVNDFPKAFKGLRVEGRIVNPRGKVLFRKRATCSVAADCIVRPFPDKHISIEPNGLNIPMDAAYGTYEVQFRLWDNKGKPVAHNEEKFQVVPKGI